VRAFAHQHARARRSLEHVIDTLDLQCRTLLVRTGTDGLRSPLALLARN
jgi:hypothetical protein